MASGAGGAGGAGKGAAGGAGGASLGKTGGTGGTQTETFTLTNGAMTYTAQADDAGTGTLITAVCYAQGTRIRVLRGGAPTDVAVDDLVVGDIAITAWEEHRPIRWLGHQTIDCRTHREPRKVWPIRIAADAFGRNRPSRDLYVSPDHALCVDVVEDVLIPAHRLINGSTVAQIEIDSVTYWHVELDSHDILLAENMPAESFLEMGANRAMLGLASGDIPEDVLARGHADFCRPFLDAGPVLEAARLQLAARAERLGWLPDREPGLAASGDGAPLFPQLAGGEAFLAVPHGTDELRLRATERIPAAFGEADTRRLGLAVYALALTDRAGVTHALDLDAAEMRPSFHAGERRAKLPYRWTNGDLVIPSALLAGLPGPIMLRLTFEPTTVRGWVPPAVAAAKPGLRVVA